MNRNLLVRIAVPALAASFVAGCCGTKSGGTASETSYTTRRVYASQGAPPSSTQRQVTTASSRIQTTNEAEIQLHKEELVVGKKNVSNGGVLIRTTVQTENVSQPVELRREEYTIERIPAGQAAARNAESSDTAFQNREYFIPLMREEAVTSKRAVVSETVAIGKRTASEQKTVSGPVRTEDVQVTKVTGTKPASSAGSYESARTGAATAAEGNSINLIREELVVGKAQAEDSGVKVQKIVRTQTASQPVDLKREEYTIDRTPGNGQSVADANFSARELRVDLSREEPVIGTRISAGELVRVNKQMRTDTETVRGTVRKQGIEVVKMNGDQSGQGGTSAAGQSGATYASGSSNGKKTITGTAVCAKCTLHETATCQPAIQVKENGKTVTYYVQQNDVSKKFPEDICHEGKKVTATGTVNGTKFTPTQMTLAN